MRFSLAPAAILIILLLAPVMPSFGQVPQFGHVFIVLEENHSYSSVIGDPSMPYLNSLASQYGLATNYYANTHPSIGNYFMLTTGQIITNDDSFSGKVSADNIVRQLLAAGKTWKCYAESLPAVGYTGGDVYPYIKHHNPFAYLTDVVNSSVQLLNLVPFSQFATDLANNTLPHYSFIVPNNLNNAHDGTLEQADSWLQANIQPLISSTTFQQDGLLVIVFDESFDTDTAFGGGQVAMLVISPKGQPGYQSTIFYQHQSTLRMMAEGLGLTSFPGASATAPDMGEFFATLSSLTLNPNSVAGGSSSQGTVTLSGAAPSGGAVVTLSSSNTAVATVPASVTVSAGATSATFTVTTSAVTASTSVTLTASYNGTSKIATLTVQPTVPPPPTGLTATAGPRAKKVSLSWTASSGATSYNVKRSTTSGGPYTTIATWVTTTSYTDVGLTSGTKYYYVVSAVNSAGESANSNQASATAK